MGNTIDTTPATSPVTNVTVTVDSPAGRVADADVWVTRDADGLLIVDGVRRTNSAGQYTFRLAGGVSYFFWLLKDGLDPMRGRPFTAEPD